jgi:hypothetical protein
MPFRAQYQQSPIPEAGAMIQRDWFRFYETLLEQTSELGRRRQRWLAERLFRVHHLAVPGQKYYLIRESKRGREAQRISSTTLGNSATTPSPAPAEGVTVMRGDQFLHDGAIQTQSGGGLLVELREMAVSLHIGGEYRSEPTLWRHAPKRRCNILRSTRNKSLLPEAQ